MSPPAPCESPTLLTLPALLQFGGMQGDLYGRAGLAPRRAQGALRHAGVAVTDATSSADSHFARLDPVDVVLAVASPGLGDTYATDEADVQLTAVADVAPTLAVQFASLGQRVARRALAAGPRLAYVTSADLVLARVAHEDVLTAEQAAVLPAVLGTVGAVVWGELSGEVRCPQADAEGSCRRWRAVIGRAIVERMLVDSQSRSDLVQIHRLAHGRRVCHPDSGSHCAPRSRSFDQLKKWSGTNIRLHWCLFPTISGS